MQEYKTYINKYVKNLSIPFNSDNVSQSRLEMLRKDKIILHALVFVHGFRQLETSYQPNCGHIEALKIYVTILAC